MSVQFYKPSAVRLPEGSSLLREVRPHRLHIDPGQPLTDSELGAYDRRTILYDVFPDRRGRRLIAVGPPLLNLQTALLPVEVRLVGTDGTLSGVLRFRERKFSHQSVYTFRVPRAWRHHLRAPARVMLRFADDSTYELEVRPCVTAAAFLSLSTIQKDEPLVWLRQWMLYWHALGADRIIVYDNGSAYADDLPQWFEQFPESLEVIVVSWNFEYGPSRAFALCFAQWAALNHARLMFGTAEWHAAFDVDEYPVLRTHSGLVAFLRSRRRRVGQVKLRGYNVRNTVATVDLEGTLPTARTYRVRDREASNTYKYFCRPSRARTFNVHDADTRPFVDEVPEPDRFAYFHYLALNRGWMHPSRLERIPFDPSIHVADSSVAETLERFGIN